MTQTTPSSNPGSMLADLPASNLDRHNRVSSTEIPRFPRTLSETNNQPKPDWKIQSQLQTIISTSWLHVLLFASPVGIALHYAHVHPIAVFVVNFVAIIPLAHLLSFATEDIAMQTSDIIGGLLNASFGNAVELIVAIVALSRDQIWIVQTSLIGSILSNLLLVLGMCFFGGGFYRTEQEFNRTAVQTASGLLFLSVAALIVPTACQMSSSTPNTSQSNRRTIQLSRGESVMMLLVYGCALFFQLKTHVKKFQTESAKNGSRAHRGEDPEASAGREHEQKILETPKVSLFLAIGALILSTVLVAVNAECLVNSINAITYNSAVLSKNFVGLILLPIVGNVAEHFTAVTAATKDKMDLAISVALGSSVQIALLVLPFTVLLGWVLKKDMTLHFDVFQLAVLVVAVVLVNYLIQDGKSNWLKGVILMTLYVMIAVAVWFLPVETGELNLPSLISYMS